MQIKQNKVKSHKQTHGRNKHLSLTKRKTHKKLLKKPTITTTSRRTITVSSQQKQESRLINDQSTTLQKQFQINNILFNNTLFTNNKSKFSTTTTTTKAKNDINTIPQQFGIFSKLQIPNLIGNKYTTLSSSQKSKSIFSNTTRQIAMSTSLKHNNNNNNNNNMKNTKNYIKQTPQQIFAQKKKEMDKYNLVFKRMFNTTTTKKTLSLQQQPHKIQKQSLKTQKPDFPSVGVKASSSSNDKDKVDNNNEEAEFEMTPSNLARHPIKSMKALFKKYGWTFINTAIVLYITWCLAAFGIANMTSPDAFINIAKEYVPPVYNIGLNLFQKLPPNVLDYVAQNEELCFRLGSAFLLINMTDTPRWIVTFILTKKIYDLQQKAKAKLSTPPPRPAAIQPTITSSSQTTSTQTTSTSSSQTTTPSTTRPKRFGGGSNTTNNVVNNSNNENNNNTTGATTTTTSPATPNKDQI